MILRSLCSLLLLAAGCAPAAAPGDDDSALAVGPADLCLSGSEGFGTQEGDCAEDFELADADGALWSLHERAGDVILIDLSAFW